MSMSKKKSQLSTTWFGLLLFVANLSNATASDQSMLDLSDPPQGLFDQQWLEVYLMGQKVGYAHITFKREDDVVSHRNYSWMKIARDSIVLEIEADYATRESLTGQPVSFNHSMTLAGQPVVSSGTIEDGDIAYQLQQGSYALNETVPFPKDAKMPWGARLLAEAKGTEPGTAYAFQLYSPDIDFKTAMSTKVLIVGEERFDFRGQQRRGLRKDETLLMGGTEIVSQSWLDEQGRLLKTVVNMAGMPLEMYTADADRAVADFVPAELFLASFFQLGKPLPRDAQQATYSIIYRSGASDIVEPITGAYQQVQRVSPNAVHIVVQRADHATIDGTNGDITGLDRDAVLNSNLMINAADPKIVALANQALPQGWDDRIAAAHTLRTFVTAYINDKNLNVGFASASEVARDPRGDCTEHAVLLAALGRVHGLPARVAGGLVYLPEFGNKENIMGYHMWTQFYIDGRWLDFDAALGESECAPTRIALLVTSLHNASLTEVGMDLLQLGRIDVELVEVE